MGPNVFVCQNLSIHLIHSSSFISGLQFLLSSLFHVVSQTDRGWGGYFCLVWAPSSRHYVSRVGGGRDSSLRCPLYALLKCNCMEVWDAGFSTHSSFPEHWSSSHLSTSSFPLASSSQRLPPLLPPISTDSLGYERSSSHYPLQLWGVHLWRLRSPTRCSRTPQVAMETSSHWGKWQFVMAGCCQACEVEQMGVCCSHMFILSVWSYKNKIFSFPVTYEINNGPTVVIGVLVVAVAAAGLHMFVSSCARL